MTNLTPKQAASVLGLIPGAIEQAIETEQAVVIIDLEGDIKQEVFFNGKDANGQTIGEYSTAPIYVSIADAKRRYGSQIPTSKLKGRGAKKKGSKFANGNERKSMYFGDGYSGFRRFMNRPVDKVNLKLTGNLAGSIASGTKKNVSTIAFTNEEAAELAGHHETMYDTIIYAASDEQVRVLTQRLREVAEQTLNKLLP